MGLDIVGLKGDLNLLWEGTFCFVLVLVLGYAGQRSEVTSDFMLRHDSWQALGTMWSEGY